MKNNVNNYKRLYQFIEYKYSSNSKNYVKLDNVEISESVKKDFDSCFQNLIDKFESHPAVNHPFFQYLDSKKNEGFNSLQFKIYRDNFFYRTELTIPSVAKTIERAALAGDYKTVAQTAKNLFDEGGYGNHEKVHSKLLLDSHNNHGWFIFGLEPVNKISDVKKSPYITQETRDYRKSKEGVFKKPYNYVIGNIWAHEFLADGMLENFRKSFFEIYKGYYTKESYENLIEFYKAHRDDDSGNDVEAEHERMAREAVIRACNFDTKNFQAIEKGSIEFMDKQGGVWDSILVMFEKNEKSGVPIPPRANNTSSKVENPTAKLLNKKENLLSF